MSSPSYASIRTPDWCIAGTGNASVSAEVADVQRLLAASGLVYSLHSAGTTVEGPWNPVMQVIGQAHEMLHQKGCVRIQSDIRVGSRTDKPRSTAAAKVDKVKAILSEQQ